MATVGTSRSAPQFAPALIRTGTLARAVDRGAVHGLLLTLWCLLLFFYGIDRYDLWRTEGLRAGITREMLASGNWLVPTLYGEPVFTKPPVMYLAVILCSLPFGAVTDVSARLPSALAGALCVLVFYFACRRWLGRNGALAGALILPMSALWLEKAPAAEIDMLQVFWIAASLLCLFRAVEAEEQQTSPARWWYSAMMLMALGVLTKWTAPAFFYGTAVPFLWCRGRLRLLWSRHHLLGLGLAVSLCLGWIVAAVAQAGWDTFYETVKQEGLARLVPNYDRPYRLGEALVHPFKLLAMSLPWSALALWSLHPRFHRCLDERRKFFVLAMHCWTWPNILICTYLAEHTPRHSFPLFPGIAGLAAAVWVVWYEGRFALPGIFRVQPRQLLIGLMIVWLTMKTVYVEKVLAERTQERQTRAKGETLARFVPQGTVLYLFRFKDDGLLFYFGRPARRLAGPADLPRTGGPVYCVLSAKYEWADWPLQEHTDIVHEMTDQQGDTIFLVRVCPFYSARGQD